MLVAPGGSTVPGGIGMPGRPLHLSVPLGGMWTHSSFEVHETHVPAIHLENPGATQSVSLSHPTQMLLALHTVNPAPIKPPAIAAQSVLNLHCLHVLVPKIQIVLAAGKPIAVATRAAQFASLVHSTHLFGDTVVSQVVLNPRPAQGDAAHSSSLGPSSQMVELVALRVLLKLVQSQKPTPVADPASLQSPPFRHWVGSVHTPG